MSELRRPCISIGLPVYNGERFVGETIRSLLAQAYDDFELIISDNASTDRTEAVCREYERLDARVRYHRASENLGAAWNYTRVFQLATGRYFKWAASDDVCLPTFLEKCKAVLDEDPSVVLAYPRTCFVDEHGKPVDLRDPGWDLRSDAAHERLRYVIYAGHWVNVVYGVIRTEALARCRLLASYPGGDYRVLGELSVLGKFVEIPERLMLRRLHRQASSQNKTMTWQMHFYTGQGRKVSLPVWNRSLDHFRTILRSDLTVGQKLSVTRSLLRRMRWQRRKLLREIGFATAAWAGRCVRRARFGDTGVPGSRAPQANAAAEPRRGA